MAQYDARTALIVVDMQNDFADPRGALYVRGGEEVLPVANAEIAKARAGGALVVYTQDWHPPSTPHFAKDGGTWPVHCVRGTWGAELHPQLDVPAEADEAGVTLRKVVRTGTGDEDGYSAFEASLDPSEPSRLERLLREHGIEGLVVLGLATDYCVRATTLDGLAAGFGATVLRDGVRPVDLQPGDGERALDEMRRAGAVVE
ncbi:MAG TPA: isochorismatase family protein [Thermoanaerobaculia bacterium]|nr:isochorismatase family protein [Thermoanaerobaculia bacterium]